jgi:type IV pilus assembly protein PilQ
MRRYAFLLLCILPVLGSWRGHVSADTTAGPARLTAITSTLEGPRAALIIEASEPVAYVPSRPDPETLVLELRNVTTEGYANGVEAGPGGPIRGVAVENVPGAGGVRLARVRVTLGDGVSHRVRSQRNLIVVDLDTPDASAVPKATRGTRQKPAASDADGAADLNAARPVAKATHGQGPASAVVRLDPITALGPDAPEPATQTRVEQVASVAAAEPAPEPSAPADAVMPASLLESQGTTISRTGTKQYTGHPVSLDFQGADLRAVLRTFAEISGLNIVIDPAVQGSVDVALRDVPWDQALDIILRANKLGYFVDGTIVRVAPLTVLAEEEKQRRKLSEEQALSGELKVMTRTLSYAKAEDVSPLLLKSALSQRGTVQVDPRTNTLIISDLQSALDTASNLIATLDQPQPQVEIEARIVQTTSSFLRDIGVSWGFNGEVSPRLGNTTPLAFPNRGALAGGTGAGQQTPGGNPVSNAVNLGVPGATSAVGLALGSVNGAFNLDVALSALERTGRGRILSTPRVSTQNNIEAEITQGVQIPIQTVANNTVTVTFKDAALTLKVTPQITSAGTVIMKISVENAQADFSRSVNGIPPIDTQRANTQVLVSDGQTTVIGGIYLNTEQAVNDRTPALHRLPLLGWMFKKDRVEDQNRELLIFITPRILKT